MLLMLLAFSWFYKAKSLYQAFGFYDSTPTVVGLIIVCQFVMTPYSELISFLVTVNSPLCFSFELCFLRVFYCAVICV